MTSEEFKTEMSRYDETIAEHQNEVFHLRNERDKVKARYVQDAFRESGYVRGQKYMDKEGVAWFVAGAFESRGDVYLLFNKAKKDGTMSKLSGMGNGQPHIRIK